jgi:hypothetical protein
MSFMRFMANDVVKEASGEKPAAEQTEQKPEGRASLTTVHHWGAPGLTEVDPNFHGTGSRYGAEQKRRQNSPARYLPRIYFGGDRYAESPEFDDAKPRYAAQIDTAKFLDLSQGGPELDAMIAKAKELAGDHPLTSGIGMDAFTELENLVKDAGYQGLYNAQQDVYISFDKQAVTPVNGDVRASLAQTKTPEFKKWFGDSKVVDADGKPLVVYHGTVSDFTEFKKARNDIGMHFGTPEQANHRVLAPGYDPLINVMPVFLSIKNPLRVPDAANWDDARNFIDVLQDGIDVGTIDGKDVEAVKRMQAQIRTWIDEPTSRRNQSDYIRKAIQDEGYDGVVYKNEYEGSTDTEDSYIAFDPTQIKSATGNTGAFDGENPDIRYSVVPDSEAPNKTEIAYKLFRTKKSAPGQLFPLFIGAKTPTPIGQWVKAEYLPTPGFSPRPGWHVGVAPQASHLMKKDGTLPNDRVWAEVEIPADVDWQPIADQQPTKDIRGEVPVGGSYRFKRPANQGGEWRIAGALKVNRILTPEDVAKINGDRRFSIVPDALGFYSPAESAVDGLRQELFSVEQLRGVLQKLPGVKQEELEDNGFYEWLEGFGDGKVTKSQATEFLRNGGPKLKEVVYGNSKETYMPLWASAEMRELAAEHEEGGGTITARFWKTEAIHQNNVAAQLQARIDEDGDASPSFMRETRQEAIADARAREEQAVALYRSTRWHFATQQLFEQGLYNEEELGEMSPDGAVKTALSEVDGLTPEMLDDMSTSSVNSTVHETYQMDGVKTGYKETLIEMPATETSSEGNRAEVYDENGEYWGRVTRGDPRYDLAVSRGYKIVFDKKTNDASFKTGHWPNEKNVIVHLRNNIRTWIGGLKSYHIEEIQSDWHQKGRNTGYAGKSKKASSAEFVKDEGWIIRDANGVRMMSVGMDRNRPPEDAVAYAQKLIDGGAPAYLSAVPDAPFKKSHVMLAFKVALRDAVKAGAKYITWTTAKTQALRYANSMRGVANNLGWIAKKDGSGKIVSIDMIDGKNVSMDVSSDGVIESAPATDWIGNPLASVIGKSMAEKVLTEESGEIAGEDFTVDAEHFNLLYDSKGSSSGLPKWVSAYVKKWGVKPELTPISEQEEKTYEQFYRWAEEVAPLSKIKEAWNRYNKSMGGGNASPKFNHMTEELWRINDPIVEAFRAQTTGDKVWAVQITTEMAADVEAGQPRYSIVGKAAQTVGFYELAEDMESKGGDPMQIWKVTGWWRGPDNKWRFELFDTFELDLEWLGDRPTGEIETTVGAVVKNEKLFKAYPQMRDIKLVLTKTSGLNEQGLFDDGTNKYDSEVSKESKAWEIRIMFNSAFSATEMMRHEFQHAIQRIEDFARGGNPSMAVLIMRGYKTIKQYKEANDAIRKQIREIKENGSGSMASEAKKLDLEAKLREMELMDGKLANRYYKSLAGEVESRLVELRAEMSNQERMGQPPWETMRIMMETEKLLDDSGEVKNALIMPPVDFNRASIVSGVGDTVENLRRKLAKRKGTGVGINPAKRFDVDGKPLWIGADKRQGGKPFDGWVEESEQWLSPEEIKTFSEWYDNLYESFSAEFGKDADRWMVAWLAGQQNESPAGAMRNAFRVNDRINMILHGMRGGLTDANLEEILQGRSPQGGLGAKLADFYDSGHGRDTRTYMGDKAEGGQPFVADVHTGRDSGHIDQQTLTRIKAYADSGRLFYRGHKVSAIVTKTKTVTVGGRDVVQPEEIKLSYRGGTTLVKRDMSGSPSNSEYEGISEWGNALSDHLNKIAWQGRSDWKPRQAQAVGWMRTLRQYGLPESDLESSLSQNTYRISAEVAYDQSATLKQRFPEFKNLDLNAARSITQDVLEKMIPRVVSLVAPSAILRGVRYGSGYWDGAANPSMQFWVMGSEEAALIAEVSLAYLSQQAGTARVVIGKGGKNSRAVIFNSIGMETDLLAERLSSWLGEQTDKDAKAIMGFSAQATPDNSGIITFGLTAASADSVIRTLDRFEKETGIVVDWESVPAVPYFHGNDWTKNPNGETYKEAFVGSGGREEVWSQLNDLSGEYENSVREAFSKYASQELDAFYGEKQAAEQPSSETTDPTEEVRSSLAQRSDPNREVIVDMVIRRHRGDTINNATAAEIIKMYGATIKPFHAVMRSASIYRITEPLKDRFAAESPDMIRAIRDAEIDDAHMQVVAGAAQKAYAGGAVDMVGVNEAAAKDAADTAARGAAVARTVTEDPTIKLSSLIGELEIEEERREPPKRKVKEQPEDGAGEDEKPKAITESDLDADVPLENQGSIDSYLAKIKASIREKITAESDFMEAYRQAAGRLLRQAAKTLHFGVGRESLMRAANQIEGLSSEDAVDRRLATALNAAFQYRVKGTVDMKVAELLKKLKRVPKVGSTTSLASKDKINKEKAAYLRKVKAAVKMSTTAVEARLTELDNEIESKNGYESGTTASSDAVQHELALVADREIIERFGALKYKPLADVIEIVDSTLKFIDEQMASQAEMAGKLQEQTDERARAIMNAIKGGASKIKIGSFKAGFQQVLRYPMSLKQRLEILVSFASEDQRKNLWNDKGGTWSLKAWARQLDTASQKIRAMDRKDYMEMIGMVRAAYGLDSEVKAVRKIAELRRENKAYRQFSRQINQRNLSKSNLIQLLAYLEQTDSYEKNIELHGRADDRVAIRAVLDAGDLRMIDLLRANYSADRDVLSSQKRSITGSGFLSPDPFYMPVKMDRPAPLHEMAAALKTTPSTLTERRAHSRDVNEEADIFDLYFSRKHENAVYLAMGDLRIEMLSVFSRSDVGSVIEQTMGKKYWKQLKEHLFDSMSQKPLGSDASEAERLLMSYGGLALNFSVGPAIKQVASYPAFAFNIGLKNYMKHQIHVLTTESGRRFTDAMINSEWAKARFSSGGSYELARAFEKETAGPITYFFKKYGMAMNKGMDFLVVATGGAAVMESYYELLTSQGMDDAAAMKLALEWAWSEIEEGQQSSFAQQQAQWQRRGGTPAKAMGMFSSTTQQYLGKQNAALEMAINTGTKEAWHKFARIVILNHILMPTIFWFIGNLFQAMKGRPPDDDELEQWLMFCLVGPLSGWFVGRTFIQAGLDAFMRGRPSVFGGQTDLVPAEGMVRIIGELGASMGSLMQGDTYGAQKYFFDAVEDMLPPVRDLRTIYENYLE